MKRTACLFLLLLLTMPRAYSQGTFALDQYSSLDESVFTHSGTRIQSIAKPFGQSFMPSLSAIDYIRLNLNDYNTDNGLGATLFLTLHANSMSGAVLGSTAPSLLPDNSSTITTFLFPEKITLTPNTTYYFEVLVQLGSDSWNIVGAGYGYSGGSVFVGGLPQTPSDLWFQEGIVVPEPSSVWLILTGAGVLVLALRKKRR